MIPAGPLMIEHRLIEKMIKLIRKESRRIIEERKVDVAFLDRALDFIRSYADRCHHGKEEDILFRDLAQKPLSAEHKRILNELLAEHTYARGKTKNLELAKREYAQGDNTVTDDIVRLMEELAEFYPRHIDKEDNNFFLPCMGYFSRQEQDAMLLEFEDFDRDLIHEKYRTVVRELG